MHSSMALQPFVGPWPLFQSRNPGTDEPIARPLPIRRTTRTQNKCRQTSMPEMGFEPTAPAFERGKRVHDLPVLLLFDIADPVDIELPPPPHYLRPCTLKTEVARTSETSATRCQYPRQGSVLTQGVNEDDRVSGVETSLHSDLLI
jgi:hypothetical protein